LANDGNPERGGSVDRAGWAYYRYGDTADVVGAALVGMILMGTVIATALIRKRMRR